MSAHIVPLRVYLVIFAVLLVLTGLTIWIAYRDLGALNTPIALSIALTKGLLVVLYFMHVRYGTRLSWVFAVAGFFWLAILFAFTLSDYYSRDLLVLYGPSTDVEADPGSIQRRSTR